MGREWIEEGHGENVRVWGSYPSASFCLALGHGLIHLLSFRQMGPCFWHDKLRLELSYLHLHSVVTPKAQEGQRPTA